MGEPAETNTNSAAGASSDAACALSDAGASPRPPGDEAIAPGKSADADSRLKLLDATAGPLEIMVRGITCNGCCRRIETSVAALPGVLESHLNYTTHLLTVRLDPATADQEDVLEALTALGFEGLVRPKDRPVRSDYQARRGLLIRFAVSAALMMQIMALTMALYFGDALGIEPEFERLFTFAAAGLTLPVLVVGSSVFFRGALASLRGHRISMDVTVSLAILVAFGASIAALVGLTEHIYFDAVAMFTVFLLGARFVEADQRVRAIDTLERLIFEHPVVAHREQAGDTRESLLLEDVPADALKPGDRVRVREGEVLPADGRVIEGEASIDESLLTGESEPVHKSPGAAVIGGTLNMQGSLRVEVVRGVADGTFARVRQAAEALQAERPPIRQWADRIAGWFLGGILIIAAVMLTVGVMNGTPGWIERVVAVLIVTCPCALSLATPAALTSTAVALSRRGIIVRRLSALEFLTRATHVAFDKTGTLTTGHLSLVEVNLSPAAMSAGLDREWVLNVAAGLEQGASHPVARAISGAATCPVRAAFVELHPGLGVSGTVAGRRLRLGSGAWIGSESGGKGVRVLLAEGDTVLADLAFADPIRAASPEVVSSLRNQGIAALIISGDRRENAEDVATAVGIAQVAGGVSPTGKAEALARMTAGAGVSPVVVAVGDGVNDAPMFGCADVSVALGGHAALASEVADLTITGAQLERLPELFAIARRMRRVLTQNFSWAIGYNVLAVPAAAMGWVPPWLAAVGMTASSMLVTLNAARIPRGVKMQHETPMADAGVR